MTAYFGVYISSLPDDTGLKLLRSVELSAELCKSRVHERDIVVGLGVLEALSGLHEGLLQPEGALEILLLGGLELLILIVQPTFHYPAVGLNGLSSHGEAVGQGADITQVEALEEDGHVLHEGLQAVSLVSGRYLQAELALVDKRTDKGVLQDGVKPILQLHELVLEDLE